MSARELVAEGRRALLTEGRASAAAVILRLLALLVPALAWSAGARAHDLIAAVIVVVIAAVLSTVLAELGRAIALSAYARARRPLVAGLERLPSLLAVVAVELTVEATLLGGAAAALFAALPRAAIDPARAALGGALAVAPPLALAGFTFVSGRVAVALAGRGLPASRAWVHAADLTLRRFPSLCRLAARLLWATLPLTLPAVLVGAAASGGDRPLARVAALLSSAALATAALWAYAALSALVGRDARLARG